jgi:hypothetical protein
MGVKNLAQLCSQQPNIGTRAALQKLCLPRVRLLLLWRRHLQFFTPPSSHLRSRTTKPPLSQAEEGGGGEKRSLIRDGSGRDGGGASSGGVPEVEEGAGDADG